MWTTPTAVCGHRGCWDGWTEPWWTWANLVTVVRTLLALGLAAWAVSTSRQELLLASLAAYWVGDVLDGLVARRLRQETRAGALLDVLTDRACSLAFWLPWAAWHPESAWPVALYVLEFVVVDGLLSVAWLAWPLLSCNYVDRVDHLVHRWNWWPPAKAVNTAGLLVFVVLWPAPWVASAFVVAVLVVKVLSLRRLSGLLPAPVPGCAALDPGWRRRHGSRDAGRSVSLTETRHGGGR